MKKVTLFMMLLLALASCNKYQQKGDYQPAGTYAEVLTMTTVLSNSYYEYNQSDGYLITASVYWEALSDEVNNNSAIIAYYKQGIDWVALPSGSHGDNYSYTLNFMTKPSFVYFRQDGYATAGNPLGTALNGVEVKIVIISNSGMVKNPNLDLTNYKAVEQAFDL